MIKESYVLVQRKRESIVKILLMIKKKLSTQAIAALCLVLLREKRKGGFPTSQFGKDLFVWV